MEVLLGSTDPGDFLSRQKMIEGALSQGVGEATEALGELDRIAELRVVIEEHRGELARRQAELADIRTVMEIRLAAAEQAARAAALLRDRGMSPGDEKGRARALAYLARRGYDYEVAYQAVRAAERELGTAEDRRAA
jgi:hypothetical protein